MLARLRPYGLHLYLLTFTPLVLYVDSRLTDLWQQLALGGLTFGVLWLATRRITPKLRLQVWLCVVVATGFELFASQVWGLYRYRWHNLPLYVPPGHGLVYLFGITAGATPVFQRHGRRAAYALLVACAGWALAGVTVLPALTGRVDVQGLACLPVFAFAVCATPRYALFAAIFVATSDLELAGTWFGDWQWQAVAPWTHLTSGNPPSAIAGGYCWIDASVAAVATLLARAAQRWSPLRLLTNPLPV